MTQELAVNASRYLPIDYRGSRRVHEQAIRERSTPKRLLAALGAATLLCGSAVSGHADPITVYFKYNAIDSLSGNMITTVGSLTADPFAENAYSVTSLTGTRYDGDGVATLSGGVDVYPYYDTHTGYVRDNLLYLSALTPPIAAAPPFDAQGIPFFGTGTNGLGSDYLFVNLVYRTLLETGLYQAEPYSLVSPLGLYEDNYTDPIPGVGTDYVLNPILSGETSDTPLSAPAPVTGGGVLSFGVVLVLAGLAVHRFRRRRAV